MPGAAESMTEPRRVRALVVEDTEDIAALVRQALHAAGIAVDLARDLATARVKLTSPDPPDVVVLDLELPDGSGLELLRDRHSLGDAPVVILSSRDDEVDRVVGLELGAEDYVIKPFLPRELATRVRRAAERRRPQSPRRLDFGELAIDLDAREVTVCGEKVTFTQREFDLLAYLAGSARRVVTREELLREVWGSSPEWQSGRTINEHVRRVRQKIGGDPAAPRWIATVGRAGYRFDPRRPPAPPRSA